MQLDLLRTDAGFLLHDSYMHRCTESKRSPDGPSSRENGFSILTYNILQKSLGSNSIPWVMTVSPEFEARFEATMREAKGASAGIKTFKDLQKSVLSPSYLKHFHKNAAIGNTHAMRQFFPREIQSQNDIPKLLEIRFEGKPNTFSYVGDDGTRVIAKTLRGLLEQALPAELAADTFAEVMRLENSVFSWTTRGPRIMNEILRRGRIPSRPKDRPSIVVLTEYDAHNAVADYDQDGVSELNETFKKGIHDEGYDGVFFAGPTPTSGLGVWWDRSVFNYDLKFDVLTLHSNSFFPDAMNPTCANFDMKERWHLVKRGGVAETKASLIPIENRRGVGMVRLHHVATGRYVWVIAVHMMTRSRDKRGKVAYPGEVRAGELAMIRSLCSKLIKPGESVVFSGDFNTEPSDIAVWKGEIKAADPSTTTPKTVTFDTGFDSTVRRLRWPLRIARATVELQEAFESEHRWGADDGSSDKPYTSLSAARREWIDYVFYSRNTLQPAGKQPPPAKSDCNQMPNERDPSDHRPLECAFVFRDARQASGESKEGAAGAKADGGTKDVDSFAPAADAPDGLSSV